MSYTAQSIEDVESLLVVLQNSLGIVVPDEQRGELSARIEPLLVTHQLDSLSLLASCIRENKVETIRSEILDVLSRSQSNWELCRENQNLLCDYIFSQLPNGARIWIAGCGTGQLAYFVAMELAVYEHNSGAATDIEIIATDVSQDNIKYAESALFSNQQLKGLREDYKKLFTVPDERIGGSHVKEKIRQRIKFSQRDLTDGLQSLEPFDVIICPEVLAYFSHELKADILQRLAALLKSGGIFLPGNNQGMISLANILERVEHPSGIFYRQIS